MYMRIHIIIYNIVWLESEIDTGYSGKPATGHVIRGFQATPELANYPGYGVRKLYKF